jgi:hypothetical protein
MAMGLAKYGRLSQLSVCESAEKTVGNETYGTNGEQCFPHLITASLFKLELYSCGLKNTLIKLSKLILSKNPPKIQARDTRMVGVISP